MTENEWGELRKTLSPIQIEFVIARLTAKSDREAAKAIGIGPSTAYGWPNKSDVNRAVQLARLCSLEIAKEELSRLTVKAVGVLDKEMDDGKKLDAACEVLDRAGLVTRKELDVTTGGEKLTGGLTDTERMALIAGLLDRGRERAAGSDTDE